MLYTRDLAAGRTSEALRETIRHVEDHLQAVIDRRDKPDGRRHRINITVRLDDDGGTRVTGSIEAEPDAPYLDAGYNPDWSRAHGL